VHRGYIGLWRKIQDNFVWKERRVFSKAEAWIDILMEARWRTEPEKIIVKMQVVECGYGQCVKALRTWAVRWNWTKDRVRRFFDLCQEQGMIRIENETLIMRITVCNFSTYDVKRDKHCDTNETQTRHKRDTNATEQERKEGKNNTIASSPKKTNGSTLPSPVFILIPTNKKDEEFQILEDDVKQFQELYPGINVKEEIMKCKAWNLSNPKQRKTKSGMMKHVNYWLSKAQNLSKSVPRKQSGVSDYSEMSTEEFFGPGYKVM